MTMSKSNTLKKIIALAQLYRKMTPISILCYVIFVFLTSFVSFVAVWYFFYLLLDVMIPFHGGVNVFVKLFRNIFSKCFSFSIFLYLNRLFDNISFSKPSTENSENSKETFCFLAIKMTFYYKRYI